MKKKYDNTSNEYKDWTTKKLKDEAKGYHELIYVAECYGRRDLMALSGILNELDNRGVKPINNLTFN